MEVDFREQEVCVFYPDEEMEGVVSYEELKTVKKVQPICVFGISDYEHLDKISEWLQQDVITYSHPHQHWTVSASELLKVAKLEGVKICSSCDSQVVTWVSGLLGPSVRLHIKGNSFDEIKFATLMKKVAKLHLQTTSSIFVKGEYPNISHLTIGKGVFVDKAFPNIIEFEMYGIGWSYEEFDAFENMNKLETVKMCWIDTWKADHLQKRGIKVITNQSN
jgi:hypothetical protein